LPVSVPLFRSSFFRPKDEAGEKQLMGAIDELRPLHPDFVSITRTGGGTQPTLDLTARVQNELGFPSMAHLTCVGHTADEMTHNLNCLWDQGVQNVLALRGDPPPGQASLPGSRWRLSVTAATWCASCAAFTTFCVGVAGYPEGHPQALNQTRDLEYLKLKIDNGGQFVITQLFFDNADFYRWRDAAHKMGIDVPLVAGIMPILSVGQIKRFVMMCGAKIPHPLLLKLESLESDPMAVHAAVWSTRARSAKTSSRMAWPACTFTRSIAARPQC
jgi:methylenetetrahydrofolate reductase (NADPH)